MSGFLSFTRAALDRGRAILDTGCNAVRSIIVAPAASATRSCTEAGIDGKRVTDIHKSDAVLHLRSESVSIEGSIADLNACESVLLSSTPCKLRFPCSSKLNDVSGKTERKQARWQMGILSDNQSNNVPGSVFLLTGDKNEPFTNQGMLCRASRSSVLPKTAPIAQNPMSDKKLTRDGAIILEPQPDDSENDPLNWPSWRRDAVLLSLGFYCMLGGGMTPVLAAGYTNVAETYAVPAARISLTTGLYMLGLGFGSVFASPTAILFGKRPVYLVGSLIFVCTAVWCALSPSLDSLFIARVFQGIALSPTECLASATITELFFLHERAYRISIYTLLVLGGKNLVPLVSAAIIQSLGWRWVFWIVAMIGCFFCCLLFLCVPETFWDRSLRPESMSALKNRFNAAVQKAVPPPTSITDRLHNLQSSDESCIERLHSAMAADAARLRGYTSRMRIAPRQTFTQQLKPYNGRLRHDNWLRVAIRPFVLYSYPAVLWSSVVYACSVGWLIILSESVAVIYRTRDTYNFSALSAGLIYVSPFVGGLLGTAIAGKLSDIIVRAMAKRNGGLYEPEFRLVMAIPVTATTVIGLFGFGWSAQIHDAWIVPTIFFGVISFGCSLGSTTAITFCLDSYRQYAGEALVTLNFSKNVIHGMGFSFFFTSWLDNDSSKMVFVWLGIIQLVVMGFTVPVYIFGKRARMRTARLSLMERF